MTKYLEEDVTALISELQETVRRIFCLMVNNPNDVVVSQVATKHTVSLEVAVAESDVRFAVGSGGYNVDAVRTVLNCWSSKTGITAHVHVCHV